MKLQPNVLYTMNELKYLDLDVPITYKHEFNHKIKSHVAIEYLNIPCSYDLESSSFRDYNNQKVCVSYAHAININGINFMVREMSEMITLFEELVKIFKLGSDRRMVIYVHNLAYDFFFFKNFMEFDYVSSNGASHKIMRALTVTGLEFRCSYMLSGSNLKNVAKNLTKHKIAKLTENLDHSLIRSPLTVLSKDELAYILNDVVILEYYIREEMDKTGDITTIPYTSTGYVRDYVRNRTLKSKDKKIARAYRQFIEGLSIEVPEYEALRRAFSGGFTHANAKHSGKVVKNVKAYDFASSYPARMVEYQYPMGKGQKVVPQTVEEAIGYMNTHCCLFYVRFEGLVCKASDGYISESKLDHKEGVTANNGRVFSAMGAELWMTEVDFMCVNESYTYDDVFFGVMYTYAKGYLPTELIKSVLDLYEKKTTLKGVVGMEDEYNASKAMLNSIYGMCVTDVIKQEFKWDDKEHVNVPIEKSAHRRESDVWDENTSKKRFLYYPWGVWITAYARYDLFMDLCKLGDRYVYSDTDSIYFINEDGAEDIFEDTNAYKQQLMKFACDYHKISIDSVRPKDPNGKVRPLGEWSFDGEYAEFKTLGAKRYLTKDYDGKFQMTVSGVNKAFAVPFMLETFGEDKMMDKFSDGLFIPEGKCGKSIHEYISNVRKGSLTDFQGTPYDYHVESAIHLEDTSYSMKLNDVYAGFIEWIQAGAPRRASV